MKDLVQRQLRQTLALLEAVTHDTAMHSTLVEVATITADTMKQGGKLLVAGNGGSAADSQHLVAEFVSRLTVNRPALRAVALTTDSSILTAVGNDYGYEHVFERQIEAIGAPKDVFLAISTSGNSPNLLCALRRAREDGLVTFGLTGAGGGEMAQHCDYLIMIPSQTTMNIQECHLVLEHIFCMVVERVYFGEDFDRPVSHA